MYKMSLPALLPRGKLHPREEINFIIFTKLFFCFFRILKVSFIINLIKISFKKFIGYKQTNKQTNKTQTCKGLDLIWRARSLLFSPKAAVRIKSRFFLYSCLYFCFYLSKQDCAGSSQISLLGHSLNSKYLNQSRIKGTLIVTSRIKGIVRLDFNVHYFENWLFSVEVSPCQIVSCVFLLQKNI